jgi:hypothetical protein
MDRPLPCFGTLLILATIAGPAGAYQLRRTDAGAVVRWRADRLETRFDQSLRALGQLDEVEAAVEDAFDAWLASGLVELDIETSEVDGAEPGFAMSGENTNDVVAIRHDWPFEEDAQAVTILTYDPSTGDILDADIVFNAERWAWTPRGAPRLDAADLQDVATHEVGHVLGLAHSDVAEATMYPSARLGSIERRTLDDDDLDAVGAAYDPSTGALASGCSMAGRGHGSGAAPILAALVVAVAARRRRR